MPDPWVNALPPDTRSIGSGNPPADMNAVSEALAAMGAGLNVLNPLFGAADPSGVLDSTTAINAALTAAGTAGGGIVYMPPGTYLISAPLIPKTGTALVGASGGPDTTASTLGTVIKLAASANCDMIQPQGKTRIQDIQLNGNKAAQTGTHAGINWASGSDLSIAERVFIHDVTGDGIKIDAASTHKVLACSIQTCGGIGIDCLNANDVTIRGCLIGYSGSHGIAVQGYIMHILDNDVWNNSGSGILVSGPGKGTLISSCGVDHNSQHGILIKAGDTAVVACSLHSNSQASNAGYGSITVDNTGGTVNGVTIGQCNFWVDGGVTNLVSYHVLYVSTAKAKTHGLGFDGGNATGTISASSTAKDTNETG